MEPAFKVIFSAIDFQYHSDISLAELMEVITKKASKNHRLFSPVSYSSKFDQATASFTLIRRGYFLPIIVKGTFNQETKSLGLQFKSLINPLFIVSPILLFMLPALFSSDQISRILFFVTLGFFTVLSVLFAYLPIRKEKKQLEKELRLNPIETAS